MPRKPISVWIGQILLALFGLGAAGAVSYYIVVTWPVILRVAADNPRILTLSVVETIVKLAVVGFLASTVVLISRRSPLGRWFGLQLLATLPGYSIYSEFFSSSPPPDFFPWLVPANDAQRFGYVIGQFLALALYLTFMARFGFSRASRAYFGAPATGSQMVETR